MKMYYFEQLHPMDEPIGLKYLTDQCEETLSLAFSVICDQFYVNGLASRESPKQVIQMVKESRLLCSK